MPVVLLLAVLSFLPARPASAQIPVTDAASLKQQITNYLKQLEQYRLQLLRNPVIVIAGSGMVISGSADGDHPSERSDDSRRWPADQGRG